MEDKPAAKRQCVDITQEWPSEFVSSVETRFAMSVKNELNGVKEAVGVCSATAQQALEEARRVGERQERTEVNMSELASKVNAIEKEVSKEKDEDIEGDAWRAQGAAAASGYNFNGFRAPASRRSASSTVGSGASTATTVGQARPMIIMGGWPRDSPRTELESQARAVLQKYQDAVMTCNAFVDMSAPVVRGSTVNIRFENMNDMWSFFKALKARGRQNGQLELEGVRVWITPDKPITVRNRDKLLRKATTFLKEGIKPDGAAVEIDWKLSPVWIEGVRYARIHRETGLVQFNLKLLQDKGMDSNKFIKDWDRFQQKDAEENQAW